MRLGLGLVALLAGCPNTYSVGVYGMPPAEHDPDVEITDFSYTPATDVHVGDTITLQVTLNKPAEIDAGFIGIYTGNVSDILDISLLEAYALNDYGYGADQTALDGVWTGEYTWPDPPGAVTTLPFFVRLNWYDGYATDYFRGPDLTVLPVEEE